KTLVVRTLQALIADQIWRARERQTTAMRRCRPSCTRRRADQGVGGATFAAGQCFVLRGARQGGWRCHDCCASATPETERASNNAGPDDFGVVAVLAYFFFR